MKVNTKYDLTEWLVKKLLDVKKPKALFKYTHRQNVQ
jgi:hypothetical protein